MPPTPRTSAEAGKPDSPIVARHARALALVALSLGCSAGGCCVIGHQIGTEVDERLLTRSVPNWTRPDALSPGAHLRVERSDRALISGRFAALETVPDTVLVIAPSPLSTSFATDDLDPRITLHPSEIHHVWIASRRYRYVGLIAGLILDAVVIHNRPRFDLSTGS